MNIYSSWLSKKTTESSDKRYRHSLLKENRQQRCTIMNELKAYFYRAHEDARQRLKKIEGDPTLDPLEEYSVQLPSEGYPQKLPLNNTLKGYFGEVMAALFIENFSPFGSNNWKVPAFLFRFDLQAFQYLEALRQGGNERKVPGRPGDDCLAFQIDNNHYVKNIIYCEAKCTNTHRNESIVKAYKKVSENYAVDISRVIEVLQ